MGRPADLIGQKFGKLVVEKLLFVNDKKNRVWLCKCECGRTLNTISASLRRTTKPTRSCGCANKERIGKMAYKHGCSRINLPEYRTWQAMKSRCYSENGKFYKSYGGRGIRVCERWLNSFENFYSDMGSRPSKSHSIDRIDVDENYTPSNCRWVTRPEQDNNRQNTIRITINGETKSLHEWAIFYNVDPSISRRRVQKKWPLDEHLFLIPVGGYSRIKYFNIKRNEK